MNNKIKISYQITWIITILFMCFFNDVSAIDVDYNNQNLITQCDEANVRVDYYIPNNVETLNIWYPVDYISGINETLFIRDAESTVKIWNNNTGTLNCGSFVRSSNVIPAIEGKYYAIISTEECSVSKKTKLDNTKPSAQIVYNVAYKRETWLESWISNYYYFKENDSTQYFLSNQTKRTWWGVEQSGNECYNIYTHWCGDGVQDTWEEQCDPNDSSKIGWWNGWCSLTCTPVTVTVTLPVCWDGIIQSPNDDGQFETCDDGNLVNGDGCSSVCTIEPYVPNVSIDKTDGNPLDLDWIIGANDSQLIGSWSLSVFKITVTNNGTDDLTNLVITDAMSAKCGWSILLPTLPVTFMSGSLSGSGNHTDNIFQIWETLEYYCDSDTQAPFVNTATVNAIGILSWNPVTDSDITEVLLQVPTPVIDIVKNDNNSADLDLDIWGNDSQTVNSGSLATFGIIVTNTGTEDLINVVITDPLVSACSRTIIETNTILQTIGNLDTVFNIGESFPYNCTDPIVTANYTNVITVNAIGITSTTPVTDTDPSVVIVSTVPVVPVCTNLTVSQNSGSSPYVANYTCTWNWVTSYNVVLTDPSGNIINTATATGTFNINQQWTYQASCYINWETTTVPTCSKTLNYSTWWGGWGWSSPRCNEGIFNGWSVTCTWNSSVTSFQFTCDNQISSSNPTGVILSKDTVWGAATFDVSECNTWVETGSGWINATTMNFSWAECRAYSYSSAVTSRTACQYDPGGWWGWWGWWGW